MIDDPITRLAADARERPLFYASVAVAGLAGVAAAVALGSRIPPATRASGAASLLQAARRTLGDAGSQASDGAEDASGIVRDLAERLREASAPDRDRDRDAARRDETASGGIGGGTMAVFAGTLLSKAFTGWMRLQAEERARAQGAALSAGATGGKPDRGAATSGPGLDAIDAGADGFDLEAHLEDLGVAKLRTLASEHDIQGRSSMNKDELVRALCGHD